MAEGGVTGNARCLEEVDVLQTNFRFHIVVELPSHYRRLTVQNIGCRIGPSLTDNNVILFRERTKKGYAPLITF